MCLAHAVIRLQVVMGFSAATVAALAAFWVCPNVAWMQWGCVAMVGFALYGPQMLIGLCGAEAVSPPSVSACQGFLGWIAYLGKPPSVDLHRVMSHKYGCCCREALSYGDIFRMKPATDLLTHPQSLAAHWP